MKKTLKLLLAFSLILSCTNNDLELNTNTEENNSPSILSEIETSGFAEQKRIVLGQKLKNPYSLESMQKAFDYYNQFSSLKENTNTKSQKGTKLTATHYYVKINPTDQIQLKILDDLDNMEGEDAIVIHDYPLEYEILEEGDFYVNPKDENDLYYPAYVVIPSDYNLPSELQFDKQADLYKPDEDEDDIESISIILNGSQEQVIEEFGRIVTVEELPMLLSLDENNPQDVSQYRWWFSRRYRPYGWVRVENTETNKFEHLKKAKISIGRGFWWRYTYTDNNGYFRSSKRYRGRVRIRAKWRGYTATIRKAWNEMLGFWVSDHLMSITRYSNGLTRNINSWERHLWYKGTVHNGLRKYNDFALARGVNRRISYANIWVWEKGSGSASTPMLFRYPQLAALSQIAGLGEANLWEVMISANIGGGIRLLPPRLRPDQLYTGLKDKTINNVVNTARIEQLVFHESAHYSHARKAGAWFWAELFAAELVNSIHNGNPYLGGDEPTYQAGRRIALAEGWATFFEFKAIDHYYEKAWDNEAWQNNPTTFMENFDVYTIPMTQGRDDNHSWFLSGIIHDILDNHTENNTRLRNGQTGNLINPITDNLYLGNNISFETLYNLLHSNIESVCELKAALIATYPRKTRQINQLFYSYGYYCGALY